MNAKEKTAMQEWDQKHITRDMRLYQPGRAANLGFSYILLHTSAVHPLILAAFLFIVSAGIGLYTKDLRLWWGGILGLVAVVLILGVAYLAYYVVSLIQHWRIIPQIVKAQEKGIAARDAVIAGQRNSLVVQASQKVRGYVYLILSADGCVKIGIAGNPQKRLQELQIGHAGVLRLIHIIPSADPEKLERKLHLAYGPKRVRGEWFQLTDEDIQQIIKQGG